MFGFSGKDWKNVFGLGGVPGYMNVNQQLMGGMFPGLYGGGEGGYDGSATNMSQLLAAMRNQGGGGGMQQQQGPYIGGEGLI